jgi:hypothetical protein
VREVIAMQLKKELRPLFWGLLVIVAVGCNSTRWNFLDKSNNSAEPDNGKVQSVASLVEYLNENAGRVKSIQVNALDVTCSQGSASRINLHGKMVAEKPRGFRMSLDGPLGFAQVADLGSNNEEFWFWLKAAPGQKEIPYQYFCSYKDLEKGVAFMPIPFQPEWIMEALGLGPYGPAERYQLEHDAQTLRLVEDSRSPQGTAVRKVIVMKRKRTTVPDPQITHFLLIDKATNKEICSAHITQTMTDPTTGAILPRKIDLSWPKENATLSLIIDRATVNVALPTTAFVRQPLNGVQTFNLARGVPDGGVQRAQGLLPGTK